MRPRISRIPFFAIVAACLCAMGVVQSARPARAADAEPSAEVKPLDLLKRAVDAHAKLGPVTLECKTEITVDDRPLGGVIEQTVQRNDLEHTFTVTRIMVGRHAESTFHEYVDGDVRVTYNADDKEYGRTPEDHDMFRECLDAVRGGLLYPEQSKDWGKARVKALKFERAPAHCVTVKNLGIHHRSHPDPQSVTLTIDDATGLVRQYEVGFEDDVAMTMTVAYKPESKPFPASTFTFTPPAGAKESKPGKTDLK